VSIGCDTANLHRRGPYARYG